MNRITRAALAALALALGCAGAFAQSSFPTPGGGRVDGHPLMCPNGSTDYQGLPVMIPCGGSANPVDVNATVSVSASIAGFQPTPAYAQLSVGASSTRVALPAGTVDIVYNTGANPASVTLGNASVSATGANDIIPAGGWMAFVAGSNVDLAGIEATGAAGTTTLVISGGTGLPTGAGSGGGGSSSSSVTSFQANGNYLNVPSVTNTSANSPLPAGANDVLYNYGGYKIIYQLSASGASTVTTATADGVLQPGATVEVAAGSNTNIAYATTSASLTSSLQVVGGSGLWSGSSNNNLAVGQTGLTAPSFASEIGALDNSNTMQALGAAPAGTSTTHNGLAIQGVSGGFPVPVSGSLSFSQFAPNGNFSTPLTVGSSSTSAALPSGGGNTVIIYNAGANAAFVNLGTSSAVTATVGEHQVPPGAFLCFGVGSNTFVAAIESAGATTINMAGGSGGCAGSGGGGTGGSVTVSSSALPTGAATAANQEVTTAGTSAASAQAVQGVNGGVAMPSRPAQYVSAGAGQYGIAATTSTALTVPSNTLYAQFCVEGTAGGTARYTQDGSTTPTLSTGIPTPIPNCWQISGISLLNNFRIIGPSGTTFDADYVK